jgi:hypothetical protein
MKLLITTQVYENYAWNEDGTIGTGDDAYWKAKGGNDYIIKNFRGDEEKAAALVMAVRDRIEQRNDYFEESIIGWDIVEDDYLTEFERDQLEYDGQIMFPARELELA